MAEVFALQRALEDVDFKHAFAAFCEHLSNEASIQCREAMYYPPKIELAIGLAAQAQAAKELRNKLEAFVKDQLSSQ